MQSIGNRFLDRQIDRRRIWDVATAVVPNGWLLGAAKADLAWTGLLAVVTGEHTVY